MHQIVLLASAILLSDMALIDQQAPPGPPPPRSRPWTEELFLSVPEDIKPTGQHGTVVIEGDVTPDAHIANLTVVALSGAELIDKFVQERFSNARLGEDIMMVKPSRIQLKIHVYNTRGMDFGERLPCSQAVLDADWYKSKFPEGGIERSPLNLLIRAGGNVLGRQELSFAIDRARYDRIWAAAIEMCRTAPTATFLPTLIEASKKQS